MRYRMEKLHAEKTWLSSWQNKKNRGKIGFAFSTLAEWWKWKMLHWLIMRHCVWMRPMRPGTIWWYGGVWYTKNYLPPSGNKEYNTTASQHETMRSRTLCWFVYLVASRVCQRLIGLLTFNRLQNKCWGRMLPQLQQLLRTDNENNISVITISPHSLSLRSHTPHILGTARVSRLVTQAQLLLFAW